MRKTFLLLFSFALLFACSKKEPEKKSVIATVNGKGISVDQFISMGTPRVYPPIKVFSTLEGRKAILDDVIQEEVLIQAALDSKVIEKSDRLRRILIQGFIDEQLGYERYEPNQEDLKKYFEAHRTEIEKVKARNIFIKPKDVNDPQSWDEAKKRADSLLAKMRAKGAKLDFAAFAKEHSQDETTKNNGGELPFFTRKQMVADFTLGAFAIKNVGDLSDPVKTPYGYNLIQLTADQRGFEASIEEIKRKMNEERRNKRVQALIQELKGKANIKIDDKVLAATQPK